MPSSSSNAKPPLHNFSLPDLKWSKKNLKTSVRRSHDRSSLPRHTLSSPAAMPHRSPVVPLRCSPLSNSTPPPNTTNSTRFFKNKKANGVESSKKGSATSSSPSHFPIGEKPEKFISLAAMAEKPVEKAKSLLVRLKINQNVPEEENFKKDKFEVKVNEVVKKPWNLQPRRPKNKKSNAVSSSKDKGKEKADSLKEIKPKRPKFSISLTRQEIDEDFLAMTGVKPSRKPNKRSKNVQKQLDNIFPAVLLASANSDSYKSLPKGI